MSRFIFRHINFFHYDSECLVFAVVGHLYNYILTPHLRVSQRLDLLSTFYFSIRCNQHFVHLPDSPFITPRGSAASGSPHASSISAAASRAARIASSDHPSGLRKICRISFRSSGLSISFPDLVTSANSNNSYLPATLSPVLYPRDSTQSGSSGNMERSI